MAKAKDLGSIDQATLTQFFRLSQNIEPGITNKSLSLHGPSAKSSASILFGNSKQPKIPASGSFHLMEKRCKTALSFGKFWFR